MISHEQFGFIQGKSIQNCIAGAFECLNNLNTSSWVGNFAMKIDISKAFDIIRWDFLFQFSVGLVFLFFYGFGRSWTRLGYLLC